MTLLITALGGTNLWSLGVFWPLECDALFSSDVIKTSLYVLPFGIGVLVGVIFVNAGLSVFRGYNREMLIVSRYLSPRLYQSDISACMAAGIGGLAAVDQNTPALGMALSFLGSVGIGGTVQPAVTMLTIISPDEMIATITAASISIRLIGATVGYALNFNIFENRLLGIPQAVINVGVRGGLPLPEVLDLAFALSSQNATALGKFPPGIVVEAEAAALAIYVGAFKTVYLVSLVFSGGALIASCFLKDIREYLVDRVAVELQ
jgi:hypothetical protein